MGTHIGCPTLSSWRQMCRVSMLLTFDCRHFWDVFGIADDDADSIAFGNFDGSGEIGKQLSLTTGSEGVSTGPVSFDTITEGGEQKRSLVESVKSEALKPPRRATSAPRKRPLLVNIPAPAEGSARVYAGISPGNGNQYNQMCVFV